MLKRVDLRALGFGQGATGLGALERTGLVWRKAGPKGQLKDAEAARRQ